MPESPEHRLDLSYGAIRHAINQINEALEKPRTLTDNGAVVMDVALLKSLNEAQRQIAMNIDSLPDLNGFEGGSWVSMVRVDDHCFRVRQANPLEPMSRETWHRTPCK
ncbi:hypothetical protein EY643_09825 [Halioglobus maricola]|uniref:Uncharacterized protein n=1 Tax=Halioglobus maricola TaxID=2601894 RepID=A0A5P9NK93_9GAMM|nr:hypothetical protein [Halioglobus maricola]QFU75935.1 hypothetical protein EY643_09825 [Halioglobus maricola]